MNMSGNMVLSTFATGPMTADQRGIIFRRIKVGFGNRLAVIDIGAFER
jgi:hypothetical protein